MSNKDLLNNIKKLRELTGVGFKDCKNAIDENKGDIEKSIEYLRKKGVWDKETILNLLFELLPEFAHKETGRYLDQRM